ncbi:MAG: hypothetical protein H7305_16355 [Gemmatimonadaceae bacterium]|nr:hypothetical protein [Gemmatimonadaceae bacterium]
MPPTTSPPDTMKWVYISGAAFVLTLGAVAAFVLSANRLRMPNGLFFVILIPLGLTAAAFLFGAMRSHATYKGTSSYGTLELGGPVVVLCLVVLAGMKANSAETFALTVRVHGPGGVSEVVREGRVTADLGGVRRTAIIGSEGEVVFGDVPADLDGTAVRIFATVPGLARDSAATPITIPPSHVIELGLVAQRYRTVMRGTVRDDAGRVVSRATIDVGAGAATAVTDSAGNFSVAVETAPGIAVPLTVSLQGRVVFDNTVTVAAEPPLRIVVTRGAP